MIRVKTILIIVCVLLAMAGLFFVLNTHRAQIAALPHNASVSTAELIAFTNKERVDHDLEILATSTLLSQAAQEKADDMAAREYFAHYTPEGNAPWYWLKRVNYPYTRAGENLAVNFVDSSAVVKAWMDSPTHRANILKNGYDEIGVGYAEGQYKGKKAVYVVQFFGTNATSSQFWGNGASAGEAYMSVLARLRSMYMSLIYNVDNSSTHWNNPDLP